MTSNTNNLNKKYIDIWMNIVKSGKKWVLFSNGTIVICEENWENLEIEAKEFLKERGRVVIATPLADFNVKPLEDYNGWVVFSYHESIMTLVVEEELEIEPNEELNHLTIGLFGRNKRNHDAKELEVIFVKE
ncbi:MAG: hypothetical protein JXA54_06755 [Candidatus Heimdallarchaeota archaeon]|nr:hypothetical protein [Candidatus Heimdallarchaeota archaeon]